MLPILIHAVMAGALSSGASFDTPPTLADLPTHDPWRAENYAPGMDSARACAVAEEGAPDGQALRPCLEVFCDAGKLEARVQLQLGSLMFRDPVSGRLMVDGQEVAVLEFQSRQGLASFPVAYPDAAGFAAIYQALVGGGAASVLFEAPDWQPQGLIDVPLDGFVGAAAAMAGSCPMLAAATSGIAATPGEAAPVTIPEVAMPEVLPPMPEVPPVAVLPPTPPQLEPAPMPAAPSGPVSKRDQSRGQAGNMAIASIDPPPADPPPAALAEPLPAPEPPPGFVVAPVHQTGGPLTVAADPAAPAADPLTSPQRFISLQAAALPDQTGQQLAPVLMAARVTEAAALLGAVPEVKGDLVLLNSGKLILIGHFCRPGTSTGCARSFMTTEGGGAPFTGGTRAIMDTEQIWIDLQGGNSGFPDLWAMGADGVPGRFAYTPGQGY